MSQDHYKILGLSEQASQDEIKRAYKKLAKKYHPDLNGGDDTEFKKINEANDTLGDDKKRLSLIHISEPTRLASISYAVF